MPDAFLGPYGVYVTHQSDPGRCAGCGGRVTATHMLTKSYPIDETGHWRRCLGEFVEDVVIVCTACGAEPDGRLEARGEEFAFMPRRGDANRRARLNRDTNQRT
jgi:hypothetical protein